MDPVEQIRRTAQAVLSEGSVRLYPANHRYAWPAELDLMAQLADLRRGARWADRAGAPFTADSQGPSVTVYRRGPMTEAEPSGAEGRAGRPGARDLMNGVA
jgi:hypothetical protein